MKAESFNRKEVWRQSLDESLKIFNDHYGTDIRAIFIAENAEFEPMEEGEENVN